jgi:hypothetical protein
MTTAPASTRVRVGWFDIRWIYVASSPMPGKYWRMVGGNRGHPGLRALWRALANVRGRGYELGSLLARLAVNRGGQCCLQK